MSNSKKTVVWIPIIIAISIVLGIYIGRREMVAAFMRESANLQQDSKLDQLINLIGEEYVDSIDTDSLVEEVIPAIMDELDPHSAYIPAKDLVSVNEELEGSFSGVGVQFSILSDTVRVVAVVSGGPSEKVGILAGDCIIAVDDSTFVGEKVTNERVMKSLRGAKGSTVKLGIKRETSDEILDFEVVRGDIPDKSIDAAYMLDDENGFIRVNKFGRTTFQEFLNALAKLRQEGAKGFVIDLRGNSGGYMDAAINMVNEFLSQGSLIVYTEGQSVERSDAYANGMGSFQSEPVVVLVDEFSASASEIFAGAIQDNDRGLIVGRRSFGKGLVQNQVPFSDGSAVRLTIARYYTPSGRSVQKEYKMGDTEDYNKDFLNRYLHGELDVQDSIKMNDSLRYETRGGRYVFGGGGIMPDLFVPRDTVGITSYLNDVINKGLIYQFSYDYANNNRDTLSTYNTTASILEHLVSQPLLTQFTTYAHNKGVKRRPFYINISKDIILNQLYSSISRNILGEEAFFSIFMSTDKTVLKAIELLDEGKAMPELPQPPLVLPLQAKEE